eukprot:4636412-Amphidinium_carterae.1
MTPRPISLPADASSKSAQTLLLGENTLQKHNQHLVAWCKCAIPKKIRNSFQKSLLVHNGPHGRVPRSPGCIWKVTPQHIKHVRSGKNGSIGQLPTWFHSRLNAQLCFFIAWAWPHDLINLH